MAKIINLRVQIPASDDVTTAQAKTLLRTIVRAAGAESIPFPDGTILSDLLEAPTVRWDAADVIQGPETKSAKKAKGAG